MKVFGMVTASVLAFVAGTKLVLLGFAPVLPPDFDRTPDEEFEQAYWRAHWRIGEQTEFFLANGRWATSAEDLLRHGPQADLYERWRARNESDWRDYLDEVRQEIEFESVDATRSVVTYHSLRVGEGRVGRGPVRCTATLDASYARAWEAWYANPGARASTREPPEIDRWSRMDCRRLDGVRAWLSWAGLDRYRQPPPERYAALTYAERALERERPEP